MFGTAHIDLEDQFVKHENILDLTLSSGLALILVAEVIWASIGMPRESS